MINLRVIDVIQDLRIGTYVAYATVEMNEYLTLIGEDFDKFKLQRNRETHPSYKRLKSDIENGAVLPNITLALKQEVAQNIISQGITVLSNEKLSEILSVPNQSYILDGLQRTYLINDIQKEGKRFKENQQLLLEFWIEPNFDNLIYRFIVLNSGRKAVSLNHQLELLFVTMQESLEKSVEGLRIYGQDSHREEAGDFSFAVIVSTYYCFVTKHYGTSKKNIIARQLIEESVTFSEEEVLKAEFDLFKEYLKIYIVLDKAVFNYYSDNDKNWLAQETVMNSFFAGMASFANGSPERQKIVKDVLIKLKEAIIEAPNSDLLGLQTYKEVSNFDDKRLNAGVAKRKLVFQVIKEYLRDRGEISLPKFWITEKDNI